MCKKIIYWMVAIVSVMLLSACEKEEVVQQNDYVKEDNKKAEDIKEDIVAAVPESKGPDLELIKADLDRELEYHNTIHEVEIQLSMTEERSYTATVTAMAEGDYAFVILNADVKYTKYDQGWVMDSCEWLDGTMLFEFKEISLSDFVNYANLHTSNRNVAHDLYESAEIMGNSLLDNRTILTYGTSIEAVNGISEEQVTICTPWVYNEYSDEWYERTSTTTKSDFCVTRSFEGVWNVETGSFTEEELERYTDFRIQISNQTEEGMDIFITLGENVYVNAHVSCVESTDMWSEEDGGWVTYYGGLDQDGEEVAFKTYRDISGEGKNLYVEICKGEWRRWGSVI